MSEVIRIDSVTKSFDLSAKSFNSLKEKVLLRKHKNSKSDFLAVNDVNIAVKEGETVGLIGHNGSGKSTLLKCVAGVLRPTSGRISTRGRLAALLELGAGMEPDLTARENIYLNGSLLGFSKKQIDTKFDEIIYFSELEKFIDTQVRFYSSGMQVRLGFSVAINVDPDILLIDEVLAVGDESFQRKCMSKIKSFQKEGKTIFFVSHSVDQVREICDRTIVMHHGSVLYDGNLSEGVRAYRETLLADEEKYREESTLTSNKSIPDSIAKKYEERFKVISVEYLNSQGKSLKNFKTGEEVNVKLNFKTLQKTTDYSFGIHILNNKDQLMFYTNSVLADMVSDKLLDGEHSVTFKIKSIPFNEGDFFVTFGAAKTDASRVYFWAEKVSHFGVKSDGRSQGVVELDYEIEVE